MHYVQKEALLMRPLIYFTCLSLVGVFPHAISEQIYPSNIDLKAAYCLEIKKSTFELVKNTRGLTKELDFQIDKNKNEINLLQNFLITRIPYVDQLPIVAATEAAKTDWKSLRDLTRLCFEKVDKTRPYQEYKVEADECIAKSSSDIRERAKSCHSLTWLPY
jgi:hypothetical protein